jgi:hypothetical protein
MNIDAKKPKKCCWVQSRHIHSPLTPIVIHNGTVKQVTSFKLLGVVITSNLPWEEHVSAICVKANKRLQFLKLLKRSGVTTADLLHYYKSVIRLVVEYACPVWKSGLKVAQHDRLESLQRRALRVISNSNDYELHCVLYGIESISDRLDNLTRLFFKRMCSNR